MCSELKIIDSFEVKCIITSKFPCLVSEENFISIVTDRGTLICTLFTPKDNTLQGITYSKQFIETSKYVLSGKLGFNIDNLVQYLDYQDVYECILRTDMSASILNCAKKINRTVAAKWSPARLIGNQCALALLNDTGSLDIYTRIASFTGLVSFNHIVNLTEIAVNHYKKDWLKLEGKTYTDKFNELKRRLSITSPLGNFFEFFIDKEITASGKQTVIFCSYKEQDISDDESSYLDLMNVNLSAFTWTHIIEWKDVRFSILIVAYLSGRIKFWKFCSVRLEEYKDLKCEILFECENCYENVSYLYWIESVTGGILVVGTNDGKVSLLPITCITPNTLKICDEVVFHEGKDLKVDYITSNTYDNRIYIYVVKHEFIGIYMLNEKGDILDSCMFLAGNYNVTGLQICQDNIVVVSTITGVCKELRLRCVNDKIQLDWRHLYVNINWSIRRCQGFFCSKNDVIFSFFSDACTTIDMKEERDNFHFTNLINRRQNPFDLVLNNKTNSLRELCDCLEAIRVLSFVNKQIDSDRVAENINYDNLNLSQLKTYLYLAKFCEPVIEQLEETSYKLKPSDEIQTMVEIKLAVYSIQSILMDFECNKYLSKTKRMWLKQLVTFLREIVIEDKLIQYDLGPNFTDEIFDVILRTKDMDLYVSKPCYICGNDIFGTSCITKHQDNRCILTMVQVSMPEYKCPLCERYVSREAVNYFKIDSCPLCDFPFDILLGQERSIVEFDANKCKEDCLLESVEL